MISSLESRIVARFHFAARCCLALLLLAMIALAGCKKKEPAPPTTEAPAQTAPTTDPAAAPQNVAVAAPTSVELRLQSVNEALKQRNYAGAVDTLLEVKSTAKTEAERAQCEQQLRVTVSALLQAKRSDPNAAAAYNRLGQAVTGR